MNRPFQLLFQLLLQLQFQSEKNLRLEHDRKTAGQRRYWNKSWNNHWNNAVPEPATATTVDRPRRRL